MTTSMMTSPHDAAELARMTTTRLSSLFKRLFVALCGVAALLTIASSEARADHDPDVAVEFKELRVFEDAGEVTLDYKISKTSWRALREADIEPRLNLYTPGRRGRFVYRYSVPLKDRRGRILYNTSHASLRSRDEQVRVELVGYNGAYRVGRLTLDAQCEGALTIEVEHLGAVSVIEEVDFDRDPVDIERPSRASIIEACGAETTFDSELQGCLEQGMKLPFGRRAARIIAACGAATDHGSGLETCLKLSASLAGRPVEAVQACDAATSFDSELNQCMERAVDFAHRDAGAVIAACDAHTTYTSELRQCVRSARALDRDHVAVVIACGEATEYGSEFERCIEGAAP